MPQRMEALARTAPEQIEKLGLTLMRLEERMDELEERGDKELGLDLGGLFEELEGPTFKALDCVPPGNLRRLSYVTFSASPPPMRACYDAAMLFRAKHRWLIILRHIAGTDA